MVKQEWGTKRQCQSCGARFYDLGREPIVCPKCGTVHVLDAPKPRAPSAREVSRPEPKKAPAVVRPVVEEEGVEAEVFAEEEEETEEEEFLEDASELDKDEDDVPLEIDSGLEEGERER